MPILDDPNGWALLLDLDGTLIDIAAAPDDVRVPPGLATMLSRVVAALDGAVAVISGRTLAEIDDFLDPLRLVGAGVHGAELRTAYGSEVVQAAEPLAPWMVEAVAELGALAPGIIIEPKGSSIAVHYRLAPAAGPAIEEVLTALINSGPDHLILCPGRKVFEVVPKSISKGAALETIMRLPAFRSRRPLMIGDDVSDETALDTAAQLGGRGLRVAGEHFAPTAADFAGPADVREWLAGLADRFAR